MYSVKVKFIPLSFRSAHLLLLTMLEQDCFSVAGLAICVGASISISPIVFKRLLIFALPTDFETFVLPKQHISSNETLVTVFVVQSSWSELEFIDRLLNFATSADLGSRHNDAKYYQAVVYIDFDCVGVCQLSTVVIPTVDE